MSAFGFGDGEERRGPPIFFAATLGAGDSGRVNYDPLEIEGEVRSVTITMVK